MTSRRSCPTNGSRLDAALRAFTIGSAFVNHLDAETGTIEVGKLADLVVLDRDIRATGAPDRSVRRRSARPSSRAKRSSARRRARSWTVEAGRRVAFVRSEESPRDPRDAAAADEVRDDSAVTDEGWLDDPDAVVDSLKRGAVALDDLTYRRFSRIAVMGLFLVPLLFVFVVAFVIAIAVVSGVLALAGLPASGIAGPIGLLVAFLAAVVLVIGVFRALILRFPRLRRLLNR